MIYLMMLLIAFHLDWKLGLACLGLFLIHIIIEYSKFREFVKLMEKTNKEIKGRNI